MKPAIYLSSMSKSCFQEMFTVHGRVCGSCGTTNPLKNHQRTREDPTPRCVKCHEKLFTQASAIASGKKKCAPHS